VDTVEKSMVYTHQSHGKNIKPWKNVKPVNEYTPVFHRVKRRKNLIVKEVKKLFHIFTAPYYEYYYLNK
jgi:hypothetical protein